MNHSKTEEHQVLCSPVRGRLGRSSGGLSPPLDERGRMPESAEKRGAMAHGQVREKRSARRQSSTARVRRELAGKRHNCGCRRNVPWRGRAKGAAETSSRRTIGGGGGNRTHVRWTVLARHYERSLRFIFARRKPAGGPLARLARSCSPLPPTSLGVPGELARLRPSRPC